MAAKRESWVGCGLIESDDKSSSLVREEGRVSTLTSCVRTIEPRPRLSSDLPSVEIRRPKSRLPSVERVASEKSESSCCWT